MSVKVTVQDLDKMAKGEETFTIMMPLAKNVPSPRPEWQPTACPCCGRRSWYNPIGDSILQQMAGRIRLRCTECALKEP